MEPFEEIYYTMLGERTGLEAVPWVKNAFAPGLHCDRAYAEMREAYGRICERLDIEGEDEDLEIILGNLESIQKVLCENMFLCGMKFVEDAHYLDKFL